MRTPRTPDELAEALASAAAGKRTICLGGGFSKNRLAGPMPPAEVTISTRCLSRVLQYEPRDLTISVEAGLPWAELDRLLAGNNQMVPLDPPYASESSVGGVVAANLSGPRRRLYGTARDLVIGMKFATLEGKIVQSGGMVVKNVAGLDMAKLMIGSFGTLAAIAVVNFKLQPRPSAERTFLLSFETAAEAIAARDRLLSGPLQPSAVDLFNEGVGAHLGSRGFTLAVQGGGSPAVVDRYERELPAAGKGVALEGEDQRTFWTYIREFTPRFVAKNPAALVVRAAGTLAQVRGILESAPEAALARAASGVCYLYFETSAAAAAWTGQAAQRGWKAVVESAPPESKASLDLWPAPGDDFAVMEKVKEMFDPDRILNRGRLYRRI